MALPKPNNRTRNGWAYSMAVQQFAGDETKEKKICHASFLCGLDAWKAYEQSEFKEIIISHADTHQFCKWIVDKDEPSKPSGTFNEKMRSLMSITCIFLKLNIIND